MKGRSREETRQVWLLRINHLAESGLSQREWCKENGIAVSTLRYWIRKLREPEPDETSRWLQVNISGDPCVAELQSIPAPSNKADLVKVHYGGFTLEVPDSCSRERMYELLQVVKAL